MNDEKELRAIAYMGAMFMQTLGNAIRGNSISKGRVDEMDEAACMIADRVTKRVSEMAPKKGKGNANP